MPEPAGRLALAQTEHAARNRAPTHVPARPAAMALPVLIRALSENRWLLIIVWLHAAVTLALAPAFGRDVDAFVLDSSARLLTGLFPLLLAAVLSIRAVQFLTGHTATRGQRSLLPWLAEDLGRWRRDLPRLASGLVALAAILVFCADFGILKGLIPALAPFRLDSSFAAIDRWLHGGVDPWRLAEGLFALPWTIALLNLGYHFWALLVFFTLTVACLFDHDLRRRNSYLIGFVLLWALGGNLMATALASAGPVYYERLGLGTQFAPLTDLLAETAAIVPLPALDVQEMLWQGYAPGAPGRGISAMPSMHVASSALIALYAFQWSKWLGRLALVFLLLIMVGSVLLAWHYAIDGYVGLGATLACWALARRLARRPLRGRI